jgi:hypothetical protein
MKTIIKKEEKAEKSWISTTGYRTLLILKSLIEKSRTIDELVEVVKNNPLVCKSASKDTIRIAVNTLKTAGCMISRPSKANNYKYELLKHPFVLSVNDDELEKLITLREKFSAEIPLNEIFTLNDLYSKIAGMTFDDEKISYINNSQPLKTIDRKILNELSKPEILNKKIQIKYKSPEFGEENIYIVPKKIIFENGKVYLWCYNYKYEGLGFLNIERILKINNVDISKNVTVSNYYNVVYELTGDIVKAFEPKEYETVLNKTDNKITVNAKIENEFMFVQRILQFGADFKVLKPDFFREILINKIKLIQKGYMND